MWVRDYDNRSEYTVARDEAAVWWSARVYNDMYHEYEQERSLPPVIRWRGNVQLSFDTSDKHDIVYATTDAPSQREAVGRSLEHAGFRRVDPTVIDGWKYAASQL